jgi:hypothetical protein
MNLSHEEKELRDRFLRAMLEAALPLQTDLEPEMGLQALIRAADRGYASKSKKNQSKPSIASK